MINTGADAVKTRLRKLLEIEKYMPVMTPGELRQLEGGKTDFGAEAIARWEVLLADRVKMINSRFEAAYKRQEELCSQNTAK